MSNIIETVTKAGNFKTLVEAVKTAGLTNTLTGPGPFTVFAPTDEAFAKLPKGTVESLLKDPTQLKKILTYHVVSGKHNSHEIVKVETLKTVEGQNIHIHTKDGVKVNDAHVVKADIASDNGLIHAIDTVIMPK